MKFERKENRKEEMRLKVSTQTGSPSWSWHVIRLLSHIHITISYALYFDSPGHTVLWNM
jgi:hypothetical protein